MRSIVYIDAIRTVDKMSMREACDRRNPELGGPRLKASLCHPRYCGYLDLEALLMEHLSDVHAKALHVTNNAECSRRYGAGKTNKRVEGTVVEAKEVQKAGNSRMSWFITADYDLGGGDMKRAVLNIRSVKSGIIPSGIPLVPPVPPALAIPIPAPLDSS